MRSGFIAPFFLSLSVFCQAQDYGFLIEDYSSEGSWNDFRVAERIELLSIDKQNDSLVFRRSDGTKVSTKSSSVAIPIDSSFVSSEAYTSMMQIVQSNKSTLSLLEYGNHEQNFRNEDAPGTYLLLVVNRDGRYIILSVEYGPNAILGFRQDRDIDGDGMNDYEIESFSYSNTDPTIQARYQIYSIRNSKPVSLFDQPTFVFSHEFEFVEARFKVVGNSVVEEKFYVPLGTSEYIEKGKERIGAFWISPVRLEKSTYRLNRLIGKFEKDPKSVAQLGLEVRLNDKGVRLRTSPSTTKGDVVVKLEKGDRWRLVAVSDLYSKVSIGADSGYWLKVSNGKQSGWLFSKFCDFEPEFIDYYFRDYPSDPEKTKRLITKGSWFE